MKRNIAVFLAVLAIAVSVHSQKKNDRQLANLRGPVHEIEEVYSIDSDPGGFDDRNHRHRYQIRYDGNGYEIYRHLVTEDGLRSAGYQKRTFGGGILREMTVSRSSTHLDRTVYSYSKTGRLTETKSYDIDNVLQQRTTFTYDAKGNLVEEAYFFNSAAPQAKTIYTNDDKGNAIEIAFFFSDGTKAPAIIGPCLGAQRITMSYDSNRRVITKATFDEAGHVIQTWNYGYDSRGNVLKLITTSGKRTTTYDHTYEFDSYGNWIKSTARIASTGDGDRGRRMTFQEFVDQVGPSSRKEVSERKIRYYPTR